MTMKLPRKLLSCLLVLAICATTVFGCLMTVSAATATYAFANQATVSEDLTEATINVTFTPPTDAVEGGAYEGEFTLTETDKKDSYLVFKGIKSLNSDVAVTASTEGISDNEMAYVVFDSSSAIASVEFELTFAFSGDVAEKGREYKVSLAGLVYTGRYGDPYSDTATGVYGTIKTGCEHIITIDDQSVLVNTDSVNGYSVYTNSVCSVCGDRFDYQVIPTAVPGGKVVYWDGTYHSDATSFDGVLDGSGSETDPYIIDSADDLAFVSKSTIDSTGLYFKVADGIDAIVLQPESDAAEAIMSLKTAENVKNYFEGGKIADPKQWVAAEWGTTTPFAGTFDGNGATIYGLYKTNGIAGLFTRTSAPTIKNVTLKNAYINNIDFTGGIVAANKSDTVVTLKCCAVVNNYIISNISENTDNASSAKTSVLATSQSSVYDISDCLVAGNYAQNVAMSNPAEDCVGFPLSMISSNDASSTIKNVVALGVTPYAKYHASYSFCTATTSPYSNVYTDQAVENLRLYSYADYDKTNKNKGGSIKIYGTPIGDTICNSLTQIKASDAMGAKAETTLSGFDFDTVWAVEANGGYPTFAKDVAEIEEKNVEYLESQLATDYTPTFITKAEEGVGDTEDNPYIIESLTDLYGLAKIATYDQTKDKYFKLSDDLDVLVLQKKSYIKTMGGGDEAAGLKKLKNMTADEAEEYLSTTSSDRQTWWNGNTITLEDSKDATTILGTSNIFAGTIDFNGVEIYGMYNTGGGLFKYVNNATFKNLTVKSSYVISDTAGVIASSGAYGPVDGIINIENCVVANNAVVGQRKNQAISCGGVMLGNMGDNAVNANNCLVYGNTAKHQGYYSTITGYDVTYGLIGGAGSYDTYDEDGNLVYDSNNKVVQTYSSITNSIILDCVPHGVNYSYAVATNMTFENVYTNIAGTVITNIDFESDGATKRKYTISPTIDANGRYYPYIYRYTNDSATADGSITNYEAKGSIIAADPDSITGLAAESVGLAAESVVTALNTANDATVWSATANGYPTPLTAYADTINSVSSKDLMLKAVNLTYNNDGSFNLNFHYEPAYSGFAPQLYVAQADLSGFMKLEAQESSMAGSGLSSDALMYVIENLSAREIGDTLLPTVVAANANQALWGKTEQMSIADYAVAVINGEAVYTDDADDTVKQQDKNVAAAVINYGEAAKAALSQGYDGNAAVGTTEKWKYTNGSWYDSTLADDPAKETGDSWETAIIIDSAAELAYLTNKASTETHGKYYKVADGIAAFDMNITTDDDMSGDMTAEQVKEIFDGKTVVKEWERSGYFRGHFDGNGVVVYGLYATGTYAGLFPRVSTLYKISDTESTKYDVTIKNITVKNSYFYGDGAAPLVGQEGDWTSNTVYIENCQAHNNYCVNYRKNDAINNGGHLVCYISSVLNVNNCFVSGNTVKHRGYYEDITTYDIPEYSFFGYNNRPESKITNTVMLGCTPYPLNYFLNSSDPTVYSNVYTDTLPDGSRSIYRTEVSVDTDGDGTKETYEKNDSYVTRTYTDNGNGTFTITWSGETANNGTISASETYNCSDTNTQIKVISADDIKGSGAAAAMPNLDWNSWVYGMSGEYPTPVTSDAAATVGETWYWDGSYDSTLADSDDGSGDGTSWDAAIIIDSAAELAYLCRQIDFATSTDKYYKVKDGVDSIVLQSSTYGDAIKTLESADKVQDYFENVIGESNRLNWMKNSGGLFNGNFDGNGATVYGLFAQATSGNYYCGLFHAVDGGSIITEYTDTNANGKYDGPSTDTWIADAVDNEGITIKNITVKNSYFDTSSSTHNNRRVGAIVAECYSAKWGAACAGTVNLDSCGVINCYLTTNPTNMSGGVMLGNSSNEIIKINNALVYGNNAYNTTIEINDGTIGFELPMVGSMPGSDSENGRVNAMTNSLILGTTPYHKYNFSYANYYNNKYFDNVYTDQDVPGDNYYYYSSSGWHEATEAKHEGLTQVKLADMIGSKAQSVVDAINSANGDSRDMYVGNAWGYPSFEKAGVMPTDNQMAFDNLAMTNYDEYLVNEATNPDCYMYATSLNLKTNPYIAFTFAFQNAYRDAANKANVKVTLTTIDGKDYTTTAAEMTNNTNAGRYHLYRFTDVPVEYLCKDISVKVEYEGTTTQLGTFSVEGFALDIQNAYKQDPCEYYATRVEAAKALLYYTQMINARYGSVK